MNKNKTTREEVVSRAAQVILDFSDIIRLRTLPNWVNASLTISQVKAVALLAHHGALAIGELAELLGIGSPAASILVQQLVEQELAKRTEDSLDRRRTLVSLTDAGKRLVSGQRQLREAKLQQWLEQMDDKTLQNLLDGLGALYEISRVEEPRDKMAPMVPELAREIERIREEAGISFDELLQGLREQRERYYHEQYDEE